jgi:hypothetical protein
VSHTKASLILEIEAHLVAGQVHEKFLKGKAKLLINTCYKSNLWVLNDRWLCPQPNKLHGALLNLLLRLAQRLHITILLLQIPNPESLMHKTQPKSILGTIARGLINHKEDGFVSDAVLDQAFAFDLQTDLAGGVGDLVESTGSGNLSKVRDG